MVHANAREGNHKMEEDNNMTPSRRYKDDDLVGTYEVCERLGVTRSAVHQWVNMPRFEFPQPRAHLKCGTIWEWGDIRKWNASHRKGK